MDSQICEMDKYEQSIPGADSMSIDELYPVEPIPRVRLSSFIPRILLKTD